jgi:phage terminase large subunit GpA-like protein
VSVLKSARLGYSASLTSAIAHSVAREPSPILVLPKATRATTWPRTSDRGSSTADNRLLHKLFEGGRLKPKAPRNFGRHTAGIDEANGVLARRLGPISLAEKQTLSCADRKIVVGSTPVAEATSHSSRLSGSKIGIMFCRFIGRLHLSLHSTLDERRAQLTASRPDLQVVQHLHLCALM